MIASFSLLLPIALATYFLYQAARRPIFLLGIPFLQVMRESIFFGTLRPFWIPGRLGTNGAIAIWLVLAWAWCVVRSRAGARSSQPPAGPRPARLLPEEYPLVALAVLVLAKLLWGGIETADTRTLLSQFAPWGLLLAGYWLVRGVVRRSSSQDVAAFLLAVAMVTTIGSALFILHQGLRVPIYHVKEYLVFSFEGHLLSRTFWFSPPFLWVAFAVGVALATGGAGRSRRTGAAALLAVSLVAIVLSYTRSSFLEAVLVIAVVVALRSVKERRLGPFLRRSFTIALVLALATVVLVLVLPTPTNYFLHRMATVTRVSTAIHDPNLLVRQSTTSAVGAMVFDRYWLTGAPFGVADTMSRQVAVRTPDSTWLGVVYWSGFLGVALVASVFVLFGMSAIRLFLRSSGTTEMLGAIYVGSLIPVSIATFASWTFLDSFTYAMGFWLFAFVAGATIRRTDLSQAHPEDLSGGVEDANTLLHGRQRPA